MSEALKKSGAVSPCRGKRLLIFLSRASLAGTLAQAGQVQNDHRACLQADPATRNELGKSLVHGLAGCANQLWLGNSSARAFARNVVEIEFAALDEEPAVPSAAEAMNQPNIGVTEGAAV